MNRIYEALSGVIKGDKRIKIFAAIGICAILLIMLSEALPTTAQKAEKAEKEKKTFITNMFKNNYTIEQIKTITKYSLMMIQKLKSI